MKRILPSIALLLFAVLPSRAQIASEGQTILIRPEENTTVAKAGWRSRLEDDAYLPAEGKGLTQGEFRARAAHSLDSLRRVEGGVSYERGVKRGVRWNTSSDWELLAPYVTVDSIGGDLQKEQYRFFARYAARPADSRFFYSLYTDYRALHEYRAVDPRPRNITADLLLGAGGGFISGGYALSLEAAWRTYHQSGDVDFKNPLGMNTAIIHDLGFGRSLSRFSGSSSSMDVRFRGSGLRASLVLEPVTRLGWIAGADYSWSEIVRHLKNQNETPLSSLQSHALDAYAGHKWPGMLLRVRLRGSLRRGLENVVDATSAFGTAASLPMYHEHAIEAMLDAMVQRSAWTVHPTLGFSGISASDLYPGSRFEVCFAKAGADATLRLSETLGISAGLAGRLALGSDFVLAGGSAAGGSVAGGSAAATASGADARTTEYLTHLYERLSDSSLRAHIGAEAGFVTKGGITLFLNPVAGATYYFTNHYRLDIQLFAGIKF